MRDEFYRDMLDLGHPHKYAAYLAKRELGRVLKFGITESPSFNSNYYTIGPGDVFDQDFFFDKFGFDLAKDEIDMLTETSLSLDEDEHLEIIVMEG